MRKFILATAGCVALALGSAASAQVAEIDCTFTICDFSTVAGTTTIGFAEAGLDNPFQETVSFSNALAGIYDITFGTSDSDVSFTSVFFQQLMADGETPIDGTAVQLLPGTMTTSIEQYYLDGLSLVAGNFRFVANGTNTGNGVASGTITINNAAIPEPGTWMMMLLGFGAVGFSVRRRRRSSLLTQIA